MKLNYQWFAGHDLRQLTEEELKEAFKILVLEGKPYLTGLRIEYAKQNIRHEMYRRGLLVRPASEVREENEIKYGTTEDI